MLARSARLQAARLRPAVRSIRAFATAPDVATEAPAASTTIVVNEKTPPKTGIVMLNMGGPSEPEETGEFLRRLFTDNDIIEMGGGFFQNTMGPFIAKRRTPKVSKQYEAIGGSPIKRWTDHQGEEMCRLLDKMRPESAPHKHYIAFRYAKPYTEHCLDEMEADGVERAIAFSQFPQWSCTTTGSSMNELWRVVRERGLEQKFKWSVIDRWPLHEGFINAVNERITERMLEFDEDVRSKVVVVFSAHSVPMKVVEKGDHYVPEVAATVKAVMEQWAEHAKTMPGLGITNKHILAWQSKVGYLPWMVPSTANVLDNLGKKGTKHVLVVPIAFTSDHIETLFEIGMEYKEDAEAAGISNFKYTEGLNGSSTFIQAQADIVAAHLEDGELCSPQYKMKCVTCEKPQCRRIINPAVPMAGVFAEGGPAGMVI